MLTDGLILCRSSAGEHDHPFLIRMAESCIVWTGGPFMFRMGDLHMFMCWCVEHVIRLPFTLDTSREDLGNFIFIN